MKNLRYIWIVALCLALIGCSRETVNADINSDVNICHILNKIYKPNYSFLGLTSSQQD